MLGRQDAGGGKTGCTNFCTTGGGSWVAGAWRWWVEPQETLGFIPLRPAGNHRKHLMRVTVSLVQRAPWLMVARLAGRTLSRGCETLARDPNWCRLRRWKVCVRVAYWCQF